ncbi:unnamed protein product [Paramecium primaurelia]|uniref:Alpha-type protein kinase domain-containing protein n=1 Tax=Paramecium primaurelia TaxID=5886 RepID=A0A8S1MAH1_PARPR|nr:unnamed protein product [Paramecium primaurelia]
MLNCKIICEMPNEEIIYIDCEPQNVKKELHKKIKNKIPFDNIILIDDQDKVYNASAALYQTKNNQIQGQICYKVLNAQNLYREQKELIKIKETNYEELLETQQKLQKLVEEMKEKEILHKIEIQQLSETNKCQSADILTTKQAEIEKMEFEKEHKFESDLNQMTTKFNNQDGNIIQLQDENQAQKKNNKILQIMNEELIQEISRIKQEKIFFDQLKTQMESQIYQYQQASEQANNDFAMNIGDLQNSISDLANQLQISIQETDKYKELLKSEKEQANESQSSFENTISQLNDKIRKYERDIKQLKDENTELEMNYRNTHMEVQGATSTLSSKETENKKLLSQINSLKSTIQQLEYDNQQLQIHIQNLEAKIVDQTQQIFNLNLNIDQLNEQIDQLKEEIRKKGLESDKQKNEYKILQQQKESIVIECQELKNQLQRLKEEIEIKENRGQVIQNEISKLKNQITKLEKDINDQNKLNQENQEKIRQFKTQITTKDGEISNLEIKLNQLQNQLKQKDEQIRNDQFANQQFKRQMDEIIQGMKSEIEQSNQKLEIKDHILKKLSKQMQDDKYYDKVIGLMDKLMQSHYKIYQIVKDQNAQFDLTDYEIFEITFEFNKAKELLKNNQYFLFEKCLNKNPKGNVKLNRSIQPNADSTFFKGYLSSVKEADQNELKGKYFLRKELISQNHPFTNIDEAIELSKNNFLCQLLMEQFNKILKSQKLKEGDYQIARQFVLKSKDREQYYYCEMVEEGEFKKINGGTFKPKLSETDSYFNAFSKFVYAFSKDNYIITHLQICGKKVHDMIVSTNYKGLFSTLDQGKTEIGSFLGTINSEPANLINLHWNKIVEEIAQEGFK